MHNIIITGVGSARDDASNRSNVCIVCAQAPKSKQIPTTTKKIRAVLKWSWMILDIKMFFCVWCFPFTMFISFKIIKIILNAEHSTIKSDVENLLRIREWFSFLSFLPVNFTNTLISCIFNWENRARLILLYNLERKLTRRRKISNKIINGGVAMIDSNKMRMLINYCEILLKKVHLGWAEKSNKKRIQYKV